MKKIKKFFSALSLFFMGIVLRVVPVLSLSYYGTPMERPVSPTTNTIKTTTKNTADTFVPLMYLLMPLILFILGMGVILNKKMSKKVKALIILLITIIMVVLFRVLKNI